MSSGGPFPPVAVRIRTPFTSISRQLKPGNKSGNFLIAIMLSPAFVQWTHSRKADYQETSISPDEDLLIISLPRLTTASLGRSVGISERVDSQSLRK
ncbi:hypothetical protein SXCC_04853 [Gluconacetobacter sp. SXCC-1]|nr:hypothetical protein SXCC_04853 [Gluconacetobacter sp. SXCC-1]